MTSGPAEPTPPEGNGDRRRRVRPRDWVVVGVVAVLALGLGLYLLIRPTDPTTATGAGAADTGPSRTGSPAMTAGAGSPAATAGTDSASSTADAAPSAADSSATASSDSSGAVDAAPHSAPPTSDRQEDDDGATASSLQPSGPSEGEKAPRIGPFGDLARRQKGDPLALGRVDAPVVMVMFSDYRCPFCAKYSRSIEPQLIDKYVDTGILRIEWRDLPIFGEQSKRAAIAGRAAAAQGRFWEFNRAIYALAPDTGHPDLTEGELVDFAEQAGVQGIDAFREAMDDPELAAAVTEDFDRGSALGVPSTPAFVIDGYPLVGAQPIDEFTTLIDTVRKLR